MLHTINKSPAQPAPFDACLAALSAGDAVLLIEEGVYHAVDTAAMARLTARGASVHVLAPDLTARGLDARLIAAVTPVDHTGFVDLCRQHGRVQSWY